MSSRILHVLDATTPPDALEILAHLLPNSPHEQRIVALGHRSTGELAAAAGISPSEHPIQFLHSMGWADPTGWRGLKRVVKEFAPTHVHAWGIPAAFAAMMTRFKAQRLVTLVDLPRASHQQLLTCVHKGGLWLSPSPCRWVVTTTWLKRMLHGYSIGADAVSLVRPAPSAVGVSTNNMAPAALREDLGILPDDGPIVLLGGDGGIGPNGAMLARPGVDPMPFGGRGGPRHDLGLWTAAILKTVFPRIRAIVRQDPRLLADQGLERFMYNLPDENIVVVAPSTYSWQSLLSISDLMLITADGPFAAGSIFHAFAAQVPVIGTPVDSVSEHITHGQNGLLATSGKPREISAAVEAFLSNPIDREKLTIQAWNDLSTKNDAAAMRRAYETFYAESAEIPPLTTAQPALGA